MKQKLLDLLCCPSCGSGLELLRPVAGNDEIETGVLNCAACKKEYPIVNFIPRFVETDQYVNNFSFEWTVHRQTQLDSVTGSTESRDTFTEKTGFEPGKLGGALVLDVGCGTGRFMEIAQPHAGEIVGVDLSFAVDAAYKNLGRRGNAHLVQADIFQLPFKDAVFDRIYSIGVLHHTTDTREAFLKLPRLLKTGGEIAVWVYSDETDYTRRRNRFTDLYRLVTVHMPNKLLWWLSHLAIPFYYLKKIPKLGTLLDMTIPMSNHPEPRWRVLDTFDWYSPKYQYKHTWLEVENWFSEAGLREVSRLSFPVSVKGKK